MVVFFDVRYLVDRVMFGMWRTACNYLIRFVHPTSTKSYESWLLLGFLQELRVLNGFADGQWRIPSSICHRFARIYKDKKPMLAAYPCFTTLVEDVLFLRIDHARDYVEWKVVQDKAAEMVKKMAYKVPELKNKLHVPRGPNNLYHVVSIGSSSHRRRVVKNLGRQQGTDIARVYLQLKKRLPSSSQGESNGFSASELEETLIALLEKALQAGRCYHHPQFPLHQGEGFPLLQMLDREKVHLTPLSINPHAENSSKQDVLQSSAAVAFSETKSAMKLMSSQESQQDAARLGTRDLSE
ncbi:hypothetical protein PVAP13_7NG406200 [Panicum virgatum]|uniref:Uncharacterized protein n=1 Tax=Panicum virgatum TaxID=38727 RepID=A0A8T0QEL7_PANVG|nr:hypothetical protein PVAP13_7NG406200 [Panicum virgatum]